MERLPSCRKLGYISTMNSQPNLPHVPLVEGEQHATLARITQFAYEIGAARHKPRSWQHNMQENVANVAEHVYRVAFLAMLLAKMEGADPAKAAVIALVHDCDEIRGMDLTPYQKPYMQMDSGKAVTDTFSGTPLAELCLGVFKEYKEKTSLEAKCVKDADILDAVLELTEIAQRGSTYLEKTQHTIMSARKDNLRTESAKALFDMIASGKVGPWDWFLKGPSTFKDGTYGR
jgi:putative hydrolases of HD superfamily